MSAVQDAFVGWSEESTYGTAVLATKFIEFTSESFAGKYERIDSEGFRAGQRVLHKDRWQPNAKGAEGSLEAEVCDGNFGQLLKHMLGTIASGAPSGGFTTHTATMGDLKGKSLTVQVARVDNAGTLSPYTYTGSKIKSWELSSAVDGILKLSLEMDCAKENIGAGAGGLALATPTYNSTAQLFTFVAATVTVNAAEYGVSDVSFKGDNGLNTDRWLHLAAGGKREPLEEALREFTFEIKGEYETLLHINRVASTTAAGAQTALTATWNSPQGGQLLVTIPVARFDTGPVNNDGAKVVLHSLTGKALWDGSTSPISIAYKSKDASP